MRDRSTLFETPSAETPADAAPIGIGEVLVLREHFVQVNRDPENTVSERLRASKTAQLLDELIERRRKEAQGAEA